MTNVCETAFMFGVFQGLVIIFIMFVGLCLILIRTISYIEESKRFPGVLVLFRYKVPVNSHLFHSNTEIRKLFLFFVSLLLISVIIDIAFSGFVLSDIACATTVGVIKIVSSLTICEAPKALFILIVLAVFKRAMLSVSPDQVKSISLNKALEIVILREKLFSKEGFGLLSLLFLFLVSLIWCVFEPKGS